MELDWAAELRSQPGMERVMTAGALLSPDSKMPADHLVSAARVDRNGREMPPLPCGASAA
jgi:hypothetical protein